MARDEYKSKGLLDSLTVLAATLAGMAHTRIDLLSTDLEEELDHAFSLMVLSLVALFCLGVGVILLTLLLVVAYWDTHRLLVLGSLAGFFLLTGLAVCAFILHRMKAKPRLFAQSLSELYEDRQQLESRS